MAERLLKFVLIESLINCLEIQHNTPEMEQIARICGYKHNIPPSEITEDQYLELLDWAAVYLSPGESRPTAMYKLGAKQYRGYITTLLGRVQSAGYQARSPERLIASFIEGANRNGNFGERKWEQLGESSFLLTFRGVRLPGENIAGFMEVGLRSSGLKDAKVTWQQVGKEDIDMQIVW